MATEMTVAMPRAVGSLNRRLSPALPAIANEVIALLDLRAVSRAVRPGHEIISEGKRCNAVFLLAEGIAIRYRILRDGQRQILNLVMPGDFAGITSCRFENALYSIKTLTAATILPIPTTRLVGLFETHPQLAAKLFWSFASERAILGERLIALGRRSAAERIAHFLLELFTRLRRLGLADERSYRLPLTQEMIGDVLGLSIPYVNRVLAQLREDGFARIKDQVVVIEDIEGLSALADFEHHYLQPLSISDLLSETG